MQLDSSAEDEGSRARTRREGPSHARDDQNGGGRRGGGRDGAGTEKVRERGKERDGGREGGGKEG